MSDSRRMSDMRKLVESVGPLSEDEIDYSSNILLRLYDILRLADQQVPSDEYDNNEAAVEFNSRLQRIYDLTVSLISQIEAH